MSNRLAFQTQLASIMEVLANAAVAEICKLVDDDYAVINLQMSQCQRENKALKRKLHLMELRMARGYAERRIRESSGNRSSRVQVSANLSDKYRAPVADIFPNQDELYGRQLNEDVWRDGESSNADVSIGHPVIKHDENGTRSNALLVKAETSDDGHTQQQLFIREDGVAEPVCEGVDADYGGAQVDKVDGQNSRTRHEALECQKTDDEEPDVLFIKEEHSELEDQESQSHGGMTLQDGFVESSTDICGNGASSSPAQITLALHVQASHESSIVKGESRLQEEQQGTSSQSTDMQLTVQNAVDSQTVGTLCSHDPVLPQRDVKVWDIPSSQSLLQGSDDSSNIPHSNQNVQRKTVVSVDVLGTNSTLYERTKDLESSFPRWAANSPSDTQPSCSYIVEVEQDQDCVLVQPGPVSVSGRQKGAASNRLQDGRGLHNVEADWSTVTASSQAHNQQFSHFNRTRLDATNQANLSQAIPNLQHPGVSLAGLQLSRRMEKGKRKSYICRYCGKAFTGQSNLEAHQRIHTGEKPFKCETCGKLFTEAGNLKKHQRVHTGEKPFVCNRCGKRFAWICNLRTHQQSASCGAV
ncbi:zinc finger protein 354B, partial [Silurus meridionalis]